MHKNRQLLEQLASAAQISITDFAEAGFDSLESLAACTNEQLLDIQGISEENIGALRGALNLLISQNKDEDTDDSSDQDDVDDGDEA